MTFGPRNSISSRAMWVVSASCLSLIGCTASAQAEPVPLVPVSAAGSGVGAVGCIGDELSRGARESLTGKATYYADSLAGNKTASGEVYDPALLTAAHRTLPFGTRVRVVRTDKSGAVVCVTVNDRGPFAGKERIIDLSRRAAESINMIRAGVVPVRVDVL